MEELARVYGSSLFEVATKQGKLELVREQLAQFADAVQSSQQLQVFLFSPYFSTQEKKAGLERALEDADEVLVRFLELLVEKHRMPVLQRCDAQTEQGVLECFQKCPSLPRLERVDGVPDEQVRIARDLPRVATGVIDRGGAELTAFYPHLATKVRCRSRRDARFRTDLGSLTAGT